MIFYVWQLYVDTVFKTIFEIMIALRMHVILRNAIDSLMVFVIMFEIFVYLIPFDVIYIKSNNKIPNTVYQIDSIVQHCYGKTICKSYLFWFRQSHLLGSSKQIQHHIQTLEIFEKLQIRLAHCIYWVYICPWKKF